MIDMSALAGMDARWDVSPIDTSTSLSDQVNQLLALSKHNKLIFDRIASRFEVDTGYGSGDLDNPSLFKNKGRLMKKAQRPSVLKKKPWFTIAHIRDALRITTAMPLESFEDSLGLIRAIAAEGITPVQVDFEHMWAPKGDGYRMFAMDLRMPNGQITEWQVNFPEMIIAREINHEIFEKWRDLTDKQRNSPKNREAWLADEKDMRERYQSAWSEAVSKSGLDEAAIVASLKSAAASAESMTSWKFS